MAFTSPAIRVLHQVIESTLHPYYAQNMTCEVLQREFLSLTDGKFPVLYSPDNRVILDTQVFKNDQAIYDAMSESIATTIRGIHQCNEIIKLELSSTGHQVSMINTSADQIIHNEFVYCARPTEADRAAQKKYLPFLSSPFIGNLWASVAHSRLIDRRLVDYEYAQAFENDTFLDSVIKLYDSILRNKSYLAYITRNRLSTHAASSGLAVREFRTAMPRQAVDPIASKAMVAEMCRRANDLNMTTTYALPMGIATSNKSMSVIQPGETFTCAFKAGFEQHRMIYAPHYSIE